MTICWIIHISYTKSQWSKSWIINYESWPQQIILGNSHKKITRKSQYVWKLINAHLNNLSVQKEVTIEIVLSYLIMEILNLGMQIREKFIGLNVYIEKEEKMKCYEPREKKNPEKIEKNLGK